MGSGSFFLCFGQEGCSQWLLMVLEGLSPSVSLGVSMSLSLPPSVSLSLFLNLRPSDFLCLCSWVTPCISEPQLGAGMGTGTTGGPPRIARFSGAWAGAGEGTRGRRGCHLLALPTFPSQWLCRVWGRKYGRGRPLLWARSADPTLAPPLPRGFGATQEMLTQHSGPRIGPWRAGSGFPGERNKQLGLVVKDGDSWEGA